LRCGAMAFAGAGVFYGLRARQAGAESFGALVPDQRGILALPEGFTYELLLQTGATMSDGKARRAAPDGMAAFSGEPGQVILMLNHELSWGKGGVSRLVVDNDT